MYVCMYIYTYAGERRDAAKFVWGDRVQRVKLPLICTHSYKILIQNVYKAHIDCKVVNNSI